RESRANVGIEKASLTNTALAPQPNPCFHRTAATHIGGDPRQGLRRKRLAVRLALEWFAGVAHPDSAIRRSEGAESALGWLRIAVASDNRPPRLRLALTFWYFCVKAN